MGVADMTIDAASVEAALFRSTGVELGGMQYGPAIDPASRKYKASGKGVGHVYIHGADVDPLSKTTGLAKKSRYVDHQTMVGVIVEILKHAQGQAALRSLDSNPSAEIWLHGNMAIPVTGAWYGYAQNETVKRKIITAAINMRAHGDALFITSSYPDRLQAALNPLAAVFVPKGPAKVV